MENAGARAGMGVRGLSLRPVIGIPFSNTAEDGRHSGVESDRMDDEEQPSHKPRSSGSLRGGEVIKSRMPVDDTDCVGKTGSGEPPPAYSSTFPRIQGNQMYTWQPAMERPRHNTS